MTPTKAKLADLWAERRQETRIGRQPTRPAEHRWAISTMLRSRHLSIPQYRAALRLADALGRATAPKGASLDRVDVSPQDVAGSAYEAIYARLDAEDALRAVSGSYEWETRRRLIRAAFEWPQPTMHALVRLYYSDRSRNVEVVRRILARACEALVGHWQAVDSGQARPGLDKACEFRDPDSA